MADHRSKPRPTVAVGADTFGKRFRDTLRPRSALTVMADEMTTALTIGFLANKVGKAVCPLPLRGVVAPRVVQKFRLFTGEEHEGFAFIPEGRADLADRFAKAALLGVIAHLKERFFPEADVSGWIRFVAESAEEDSAQLSAEEGHDLAASVQGAFIAGGDGLPGDLREEEALMAAKAAAAVLLHLPEWFPEA